MSKYNILIIEDHPLIIEAYKNALERIKSKNDGLEFNITIANNCDDAYLEIIQAEKKQNLDIIFLDIKLPPSKGGEIISGEDIGIKIRALLPSVKVVVATTYNDNYRINNIFKNVNPDGFLVKNDLDPKELIFAIENIVKEMPYYSKSVIKFMRKQTSNELLLDSIDRKILYELSHGSKMSELADILPLSGAAIERRKRILKELFNAKSDRELFRVAEEKGFI
ncbi:transcriptional regulator [Flavivirga aquatica]|uniref:Transcriptional regulator n=1 Tax=Flavivirga aquatica TaxID=1849968 RepID=A0A1E5TEB0_9FLAO|nr:response regulator [Flavivirga aquatica]OEK09691.1 transcriptional regulator [Flavivirga aquatica]